MPYIVRGNMRIAVFKNGRKRDGLYLFEEPNSYRRVATFNSEENADRFLEYLWKMLMGDEKDD